MAQRGTELTLTLSQGEQVWFANRNYTIRIPHEDYIKAGEPNKIKVKFKASK